MAKQSGAETTPGSTPFNRDLTAMVDLVLHFGSREFLIAGPEHDESIISEIQRTGTYEPWVAAILERIVSRKSTCLDIGASFGPITVLLGSLADKGSVFAFEPVRQVHKYLCQNVEANRLKNVFPYEFGISNHDGEAAICVKPWRLGDSYVPSERAAHEGGVEVETIQLKRLANWVRENDIGRIDLIKMDIEGGELAALEGADEVLRHHKPDLVIEFNPPALRRNAATEPHLLYERLRELYPRIFLIRRLDKALIPVTTYAQLRSLMLTGHGVEDLLCLADELDRVSDLLVEEFLVPAYNASQILVSSSVLGGYLNRYPDGWTHGAEAVFLWEGRAGQICVIELFTYFPDGSGHAKVCVACNDDVKTTTLGHGHKEVLEFEAIDGVNFLFIETDRTILAREIWHNEDPRLLGVNLKVHLRGSPCGDRGGHLWRPGHLWRRLRGMRW